MDYRDLKTVPLLQAQLMEAIPSLRPADFGYHETDLYVVAYAAVSEWLRKNYRFFSNIERFLSQKGSGWNGAGQICFDVPFAGYWKGGCA